MSTTTPSEQNFYDRTSMTLFSLSKQFGQASAYFRETQETVSPGIRTPGFPHQFPFHCPYRRLSQ
jgi:hypothetical protein